MTQQGMARTHVVLVPGFGGFDMLGGLCYYAGTNEALARWSAAREVGGDAPGVSLHYFRNFPTAGVRARAGLLREYLAKRVVRRTFLPGDRIVLVGHSTGGLDIRQLLCDLSEEIASPRVRCVDGAVAPSALQLRQLLRAAVFLSVPQLGTNVGDWVRSHRVVATHLIGLLRDGVDLTDDAFLDLGRFRAEALGHAWTTLRAAAGQRERGAPAAGLLLAYRDALRELRAQSAPDPVERARGRIAQSELELWLGHAAGDLGAVDDLAVAAPGEDTPARFDATARERERAFWAVGGTPDGTWREFAVRSYATLGRCPFARNETSPEGGQSRLPSAAGLAAAFSDRLALGNETGLRSLLSVGWAALGRVNCAGPSDAPYRAAYWATSEGPFEPRVTLSEATHFESGESVSVEPWENDGIVNTASMLWPNGADTQLVDADHGDIIGHYENRLVSSLPGVTPGPRRYAAYDLLRSGSGFSQREFQKVWSEIFSFAAGSD